MRGVGVGFSFGGSTSLAGGLCGCFTMGDKMQEM